MTVFTDRAEVSRAMSLRRDEIVVEGLSELVVADSLRAGVYLLVSDCVCVRECACGVTNVRLGDDNA